GLLARTHQGRHVGRGRHSRASEWQTLVPPQPVILGPAQDAAGDHGEPLREFAGDHTGFAGDHTGFAVDHGEPPSKSSTSKSSTSKRGRGPADIVRAAYPDATDDEIDKSSQANNNHGAPNLPPSRAHEAP